MMKPKFKFNSSSLQSFTLVELLVVVGIIAILAAAGLGAYSKAIRSAHFAASTSNLRMMGVAITTYPSDNDNQLPTWYNNSTGQYWWQTLAPYVGDGSTNSKASVYHDPGDYGFDPTTANTLAETISYGYNYQVLGRTDSLSLVSLKPSTTLAVANGPATQCWGFIDDFDNKPDTNRYSNTTPALFLDGHVETINCTNFNSETPYFIEN
jgi:prepilin-type N-terminal cleavage/methylation domain-containing protein/prepilin-type processing-associated H-X9-DG protein